VLVFDKPRGFTSHDVVARVRKALRLKKVGHGGTLDPLATGVLPLYLEEGTKLAAFNLEATKEYRATMRLGQETDTLDSDGKVVREEAGFSCTREAFEEALNPFRGKIRQVPPLFSAIKHRGRPLYRRARAGETPEIAEREVVVHCLSVKEFSPPLVSLEITCGRGTYIRSLCADIGRRLGCGAHLAELRRLRSGRFTLDEAVTLEEFSRDVEGGKIEERVLPLRDCVELAGRVRVEEKIARKVRQGQPLSLSDLPEGGEEWLRKGARIGLLQGEDDLLAIAESQVDGSARLPENAQALRILRVFRP
jgi:tRNA pseudouridine55 synthase